MLKIKLSRFGKRNQPHFRIVINEARDKRDGSYVEMIGHYAPAQTPKLLELDIKKYDAWIAKGAQPTDTVASLYEVAKSGKGFPPKKKKPSKKQLAKKAELEKEAEKPKAKQEKDVKEEKSPEPKKEEKAVKKDEEKAEKKEVKKDEVKTEKKVEQKPDSDSKKE